MISIPATVKDIRKALKETPGKVFHVWETDGTKGLIVDVRKRKGEIQVKHVASGLWITPGENSSIQQG